MIIAVGCLLCAPEADAQVAAVTPDGRFLETRGNDDTTTFDLSSVEIIQPGRFSIKTTTIDNPYMLSWKLKLYAALRPYCSQQQGSTPPQRTS